MALNNISNALAVQWIPLLMSTMYILYLAIMLNLQSRLGIILIMKYIQETFKNTISVSDNYGVQSVSIPNDSGIRVSISNNNTQVSGTAPNVTSVTNKSVKLLL